MPFIPHWLVSFRGTLGPPGDAAEEFSFGLRFGVPGVVNPAVPAAATAPIASLLNSFKVFMSSTGMVFINDARTSNVRVYSIGTNGKINEAPSILVDASPLGGTGTNNYTPWQNSLAMSFKAGALGAGRFGRIYLPPQQYGLNDAGILTVAQQQNYVNETATFLSSASAAVKAIWPLGRLCIAGKTGIAGTMRRVEELRCGAVIDTQRRRRRSLPEQYYVAAGANAASSWNAA